MGYMIEQCLQNKLNQRGLSIPVVTILTQMLVAKDDPSILNPTKFVGPFYKKDQIEELEKKRGWMIKEDPGRGYRRVVPSPIPREIVEKNIICALVEKDIIVIAAGGGGIPVYREESGWLEGVDGVIDKDLGAAVLARDVRANELLILTAVAQVAINYRKPNQKNLSHLTVSEAMKYLEEGHFPRGSMGPKIEAAINFIKDGGEKVLITSIGNAVDAIINNSGTVITEN
jgi:carbamate kinase